MKILPQNRTELQQLGELIEDFSVAMFTTEDADGTLVSRPMAPLEMDAHGALWFFTDGRSAKASQLPRANVSFADSGRATYVSISGLATVDAAAEHIDRLWSPMARPWFPEGPESKHLALLRFEPQMAEYWDAPSSRMVRMFALAASVVAGKPMGVGDSGKLNDLASA